MFVFTGSQLFNSDAFRKILDCTNLGHLVLRKIIKIVASRCQILTLKCTKIDFSCGSAPEPRWGSLQRSPNPLAGFKGPTSKERGGEGRGGRPGMGGGRGRGRGGGGREGKGGRKGDGGREGGVGAPLCEILNTPLSLYGLTFSKLILE